MGNVLAHWLLLQGLMEVLKPDNWLRKLHVHRILLLQKLLAVCVQLVLPLVSYALQAAS